MQRRVCADVSWIDGRVLFTKTEEQYMYFRADGNGFEAVLTLSSATICVVGEGGVHSTGGIEAPA